MLFRSAVLPDANGIKITRQRAEVFTLLARGMSAAQVATATFRNIETVKSHAHYLRKLTGAHDATSALTALIIAGKIIHPAVTVPGQDEDDTDAAE